MGSPSSLPAFIRQQQEQQRQVYLEREMRRQDAKALREIEALLFQAEAQHHKARLAQSVATTAYTGSAYTTECNPSWTTTREYPMVPIRADWMSDALASADKSEANVRFEIERDGIAVVGQYGGDYKVEMVCWDVLRLASFNPLVEAVELVAMFLGAKRCPDTKSDQ